MHASWPCYLGPARDFSRCEVRKCGRKVMLFFVLCLDNLINQLFLRVSQLIRLKLLKWLTFIKGF